MAEKRGQPRGDFDVAARPKSVVKVRFKQKRQANWCGPFGAIENEDEEAKGPTEDAAVQTLSDRLSEKLKQARMVTVEIPVKADKPWMDAAGCLKDEPDYEAYRDAILAYRRQVDADSQR